MCKIQCGNETDWPPCEECRHRDPDKPMPGMEPKPRVRMVIKFKYDNGCVPLRWHDNKLLSFAESSIVQGRSAGINCWLQFEKGPPRISDYSGLISRSRLLTLLTRERPAPSRVKRGHQ